MPGSFTSWTGERTLIQKQRDEALTILSWSNNDNRESLQGHVVELLPLGGRRVRLVNGAEMDVMGPLARSRCQALIGDVILIEFHTGVGGGWRLAGE